MPTISKENYLYLQLKRYLYELIISNKKNKKYKLPTEKELTVKFSISRITAQKALDELANEGIIQRFKGKGSFVSENCDYSKIKIENIKPKNNQFKTIGIIIPSILSSHTSTILDNIRKYFLNRNNEETVFLYETSEQSQELEDLIINKFISFGIDGLLIYPIDGEKNSKIILKLALDNFPIVLIDRVLSGFDFNFVTSDNQLAFIDAIKYLNQKKHKKIALFSANQKMSSTIANRISGYEKGLKACNILIDAKYEILCGKDESFEAVSERIYNLLINEDISAVVSTCLTSSILLSRVIKKIKDTHSEKYEKLSTLYFEFVNEIIEFISPSPSFIMQNSSEIGFRAAELLDKLIKKELVKNECIKIPCKIIDGKSVKNY